MPKDVQRPFMARTMMKAVHQVKGFGRRPMPAPSDAGQSAGPSAHFGEIGKLPPTVSRRH